MDRTREVIEQGRAVLGLELGSTRIKAVLIDEEHTPIAAGSHEWENRYEDGIWTYSMDDITDGIRACYKDLKENVKEEYGVTLKSFAAMGFSAMMHGYMVFDEEGELMVPFRTWRNSITGQAARELTELFNFNIPERWSIAHLYQAILNGEEHLPFIDYMTTLEGYIHWRLTGEKVIGIGEAAGMFPIDSATLDYNQEMVDKFDSILCESGYGFRLRDILPKVLVAGEAAGVLTEEGALFLDPEGDLQPGIRLCPPEGDAGTGMVATNAVAPGTGNVSAGTSVFAMLVMDKELSKVYPEIDMVTTPDGYPVSMVHCNNCTSDINAWAGLFSDVLKAFGLSVDTNTLYTTLFNSAVNGAPDCGGLMSFGYVSGENITHMETGRPLFVRSATSDFSLNNFMKCQLYSALATLKIGLDILLKNEKVKVNSITGHGGFFKTKDVGAKVLAAAVNAPISVMETAGEGGAWGMALLGAYMVHKADGESLTDYLDKKVFSSMKCSTVEPDAADVEGFDSFMERFNSGLDVERAAVDNL